MPCFGLFRGSWWFSVRNRKLNISIDPTRHHHLRWWYPNFLSSMMIMHEKQIRGTNGDSLLCPVDGPQFSQELWNTSNSVAIRRYSDMKDLIMSGSLRWGVMENNWKKITGSSVRNVKLAEKATLYQQLWSFTSNVVLMASNSSGATCYKL